MWTQPPYRALLCLAAAGWAWSTPPAMADESVAGWIKYTRASSICIGKPDTPLCAVETALACRLRGNARLCGKVGLAPEPQPDAGLPVPNPDPATTIEAIAVEYRVEDYDESHGGQARVGLAVRHYGQNGLVWPEQGWRLVNYMLTQGSKGWRVDDISWAPQPRWIGPRDASSTCLGDMRLPACAVETDIACRVRGTPALCEPTGKTATGTGETVTYVVDRIRRSAPPGSDASPDDVTLTVWLAESVESAPGPDDTDGDPLARPPVFAMVAYTLQRSGNVWRVTGRSAVP